VKVINGRVVPVAGPFRFGVASRLPDTSTVIEIGENNHIIIQIAFAGLLLWTSPK
jgi:hypothetical protein